MRRLNPRKLHTEFAPGTQAEGPVTPRRYTLTHSDRTGDLFLTIGAEYDQDQIAGLYTRLLRDEVLAEWEREAGQPALHVHCHVSGGLTMGAAGWRDAIFRRELPLVLEAFRYGDRLLFAAVPDLDQAPVHVHFHSADDRFNKTEVWATLSDYQ